MSARRTTARFSLAAALIGGLAIAGAAAPASAAGEVDGLYSATEGDAGSSFVQLSKVDAAATPFAEQAGQYFTSVEVVDGLGYAIGGSDIIESYAVFTWDIATGAVLTTVPLSLPDGIVANGELWALDTTADGVLLAYLNIDGSGAWLVSVDPSSGAITPLINVDDINDDYYYEGIATNPVDGVTYLLADLGEGLPGTLAVDFGAGTFGDLVEYPEIADSIGDGYFSEGDFDATGTLWFTYNDGVSRTNAALEVGVDATELGSPEIENKAITVGSGVAPAPQPQLAATGLELAPVAGGAAVLLALGGVLLVARRRAQA